MRLKDGFIFQDVGDEHIAVAAGDAGESFKGMIKNNDTADMIYQMLMSDTTESDIVEKIHKEYDAPREVIAEDVHKIIELLRQIDCLIE